MEIYYSITGDFDRSESWIIVGVLKNQINADFFNKLSSNSSGYLHKIIEQEGYIGTLGHVVRVYTVPGISSPGVLLVGMGHSTPVSPASYRKAISACAMTLRESNISSVDAYLLDVPVHGRDILWMTQACSQSFLEISYSYWKENSSCSCSKIALDHVYIMGKVDQKHEIECGIQRGIALANASIFSRRLADTPANICTPSWLAAQAADMAASYGLQCELLGPEDMQTLGMNLLLGVAQGSRQEPRLIVLRYNGGGDEFAPVVFVGKGVTFDAGGISLKPALNMDRLKYDMSGGAAVLGTIQFAAALKLPINVISVVPATENVPDGQAIKPGDVLRSMNGLTVEVLNTDAEGRLILADALAYAARFKPSVVIDTATLTKARFVALGAHATALYGNDEELVNQLSAAGLESLDLLWPMPLWPEYHEQIKSKFADLANIGGEGGGSITAACFLSRFAEKYRWAHLDGGGMSSDGQAGIARHVPLLTTFLIHYAAATAPQSDGYRDVCGGPCHEYPE